MTVRIKLSNIKVQTFAHVTQNTNSTLEAKRN